MSNASKSPRTGGVRFAPSPTGRFHLGNLRTAWISWCWAKGLGVPWVVRFEDIDRPRVLPGAQSSQLEDMKTLGLEPNIVLVQSSFLPRHWDLFLAGIQSGQLYACDCSRKDVQAALAGIASAPHDGSPTVYSGHCRALAARELQAAETIAWRFRMPNEAGIEDFIVARSGRTVRSDALPDLSTFTPGYHWACAIDDFDGGYDLLVRSSDLAPAVVAQRAIQDWIARLEGQKTEPPGVFHTALVVGEGGQRLEKRTKGVTLPEVLARGPSVTDVLGSFQSSFDRSIIGTADIKGRVFGEANDVLPLSQLGRIARI